MTSTAKQLKSHGGFTVGLSRNDPLHGYAVGGSAWCHKVDQFDLRPEAVGGWLARLGEVAYLEGHDYLGGWADGGYWYVEPVTVVEQEEDANELARERGEAAFFNLATGETHDTR